MTATVSVTKPTRKAKTVRESAGEAGKVNAQIPAKRKINLTPEKIAARNQKISETRKRNSAERKRLLAAAKVHTMAGDVSVFESAQLVSEQLNSFPWNAKPHKDQVAAIDALRDVADRFVKFFGKN